MNESDKMKVERNIIDELDEPVDAGAEQSWIEEAQRRHDAYLKGDIETLPGDEVTHRAHRLVLVD